MRELVRHVPKYWLGLFEGIFAEAGMDVWGCEIPSNVSRFISARSLNAVHIVFPRQITLRMTAVPTCLDI